MSQRALAAKQNKRPFMLRKGISTRADLADGLSPYPASYKGRVYCVNNITGNSGNDGSDWDQPIDQLELAITTSEAFRAAFATNDQFIRNTIYVQGTATAYDNLTALPSHCDIIGIGADPRGNGGGIARVLGSTSVDACDDSSGVRGLYMENMQFTGDSNSTSGYAMDVAVMYRSEFVNCVFTNKQTAAVRIVQGGSIVFRDCVLGAGDTVDCQIGLYVGDGNGATGNFNQCLIEDCVIWGRATGVKIDAYTCNHTVFKKNYIYGETIGVDDNNTSTDTIRRAVYLGNFVYSTSDCFDIVAKGAETTLGNFANQGGATIYEDALTT